MDRHSPVNSSYVWGCEISQLNLCFLHCLCIICIIIIYISIKKSIYSRDCQKNHTSKCYHELSNIYLKLFGPA